MSSKPSRSLGPWAMAAVLLGLWGLLALLPETRGAFFTRYNMSALLQFIAPLAIISVGMTMVIITRGIDLSVGAGVALTGTVAALLQIDHGMAAPIAIAAALACGGALGLWQGMWVARFSIPPFIVTLAGLYAYRGAALVISDSRGLAPMGEDFAMLTERLPTAVTVAVVGVAAAAYIASEWIDAARRRAFRLPSVGTARMLRIATAVAVAAVMLWLFAPGGMPVPVVITFAVVAAGVFTLQRTRFGRHLFAVGGNPEAARLAGVSVGKTTVVVFLILGVLTAVAGVLLTARTNGVTPGNAGNLLELDVITAVVIGGTSLMGGRGSIVGAFIGALILGTITKGMTQLGIDSNWQWIVKGHILLFAVLIDALLNKRKNS